MDNGWESVTSRLPHCVLVQRMTGMQHWFSGDLGSYLGSAAVSSVSLGKKLNLSHRRFPQPSNRKYCFALFAKCFEILRGTRLWKSLYYRYKKIY